MGWLIDVMHTSATLWVWCALRRYDGPSSSVRRYVLYSGMPHSWNQTQTTPTDITSTAHMKGGQCNL